MSLILWNTNKLAAALAEGRVAPADKFTYLVIYLSMWVAAGYAGALFEHASRGWLFWYDGLLVFGCTVFGLIRCRDKYGGAADERMLASCIVLGVPLGIKLIALTWLAYGLSAIGIGWVIANVRVDNGDSRFLINSVLEMAWNGHGFVIQVLGTLIYCLRLSFHLGTVAAGIGGGAPSADAGAGLQ